MIVGLRVVADHLDLLLHEPMAGRRHKAGRAAEVVLAVLVLVVPAGVDDHHVARAHDLAAGFFQIVAGDRLPLLLGDRHHDAGAEEMRQRHLVDERRALHHMRRRVDMGGVVHRGGDALRQHARLRHVVDALDLDVLEIRPVRRLIAEAMGQIVELQPHAVFEVFLEHHAANSFGHGILPVLFARLRLLSFAAQAQAAAEFICACMACLVAIRRSAIIARRFGETLRRHRHRDGDGIAERVLHGDAGGANAQRMLLAVIGDAGAAHGLEFGEQRVEAGDASSACAPRSCRRSVLRSAHR